MNGLMILIPVALALGVAGLLAFLWSLRAGQFDDLDGAAVRILRDDEPRHGKDPIKERGHGRRRADRDLHRLENIAHVAPPELRPGPEAVRAQFVCGRSFHRSAKGDIPTRTR